MLTIPSGVMVTQAVQRRRCSNHKLYRKSVQFGCSGGVLHYSKQDDGGGIIMEKERCVIVGGDAAGMSAAGQIRKRRPDADIVVYERSGYCSYSACGMPYYIGGLVDSERRLVVRSPDEFRSRGNIDVRVRHDVLAIDIPKRSLRIRNLENGREHTDFFDKLLIATGARPIVPDVPGADAEGIFSLGTLETGISVYQHLLGQEPRKAVVVGGGYIGLEMAEAFCLKKLDVTLVDRAPQVMGGFDPDIASLIGEAITQTGTKLLLNEAITGFETDSGRVRAVVTENRTIEADIVVLGLGVRPDSGLAASAGLPLGPKGSVAVDRRMRTSVEGIWSAGDCAQVVHLLTGVPVHIALGTVANKAGRVAGITMGGGDAVLPGVLGTAMSKHCRYEVARTGLNEREAAEWNIPVVSSTIRSKTRAGYYPQAEDIHVRLTASKESGRLLGGQIVGGQGAAKRIDILATAIQGEMTVAQIVDLDLGYAPPFSMPWDPVQIAARELLNALGGE